jgi:hypothetical protein
MAFFKLSVAEEDIMTSAATHQDRKLSRFAITAGATVLAIGLLTTGSVLYSTNNANAVTTPTFGTFSPLRAARLVALRTSRFHLGRVLIQPEPY